MSNECYNCAAVSDCGSAVGYGSIICMVNRMRSGQSKADFMGSSPANSVRPTFCAHCGQPLRIIDSKRFCNNPNCFNRYRDV